MELSCFFWWVKCETVVRHVLWERETFESWKSITYFFCISMCELEGRQVVWTCSTQCQPDVPPWCCFSRYQFGQLTRYAPCNKNAFEHSYKIKSCGFKFNRKCSLQLSIWVLRKYKEFQNTKQIEWKIIFKICIEE